MKIVKNYNSKLQLKNWKKWTKIQEKIETLYKIESEKQKFEKKPKTKIYTTKIVG